MFVLLTNICPCAHLTQYKNRSNGKHQINYNFILEKPRKVPLSQKIIPPDTSKTRKILKKKLQQNLFPLTNFPRNVN